MDTLEPGDVICSVCMNSVNCSEVISLEKALKDETTLQVFQTYFPQTDLENTRDSLICSSCQITVSNYANSIDLEESQKHVVKIANFEDPQHSIMSTLRVKLMRDQNIDHLCHTFKENWIQSRNTRQNGEEKNKGSTATNVLKCSECTYETKHKERLFDHMRGHEDISDLDLYKCKKCPFKSKYLRSLKNHNNLVHSECQKVKCPQCDKEFKAKSYLMVHLKHVHYNDGKMLYCNSCTYQTRRKDNLTQHIRTHTKNEDDDDNWHNCEECTYRSRLKGRLKRHLLIHQDNPPKHACQMCDYRTNYKENLKKHMAKHDSQTFSCGQCPYVTKYKPYLKYHRAIHEDPDKVKKYKCSLCSYTTIHRGNLVKQHMKTHKQMQHESYECDKCDFKTLYKAHFKNHEKIHKDIGEVQTFNCYSCSFKTKHKHSISKHVLLHQRNNSKS